MDHGTSRWRHGAHALQKPKRHPLNYEPAGLPSARALFEGTGSGNLMFIWAPTLPPVSFFLLRKEEDATDLPANPYPGRATVAGAPGAAGGSLALELRKQWRGFESFVNFSFKIPLVLWVVLEDL